MPRQWNRVMLLVLSLCLPLTVISMVPLLSTSAAQKAPSSSASRPRMKLFVMTKSRTSALLSPLISPGDNAQPGGGGKGGGG